MTALLAGRDASIGGDGAARYARHRPEQTLLYQIVGAHYPAFLAELAARDRTLPAYVQREFEDYLTCGRLDTGSWGYAAATAMPSVWSLSVASDGGFVRAAGRGAWLRVRRF